MSAHSLCKARLTMMYNRIERRLCFKTVAFFYVYFHQTQNRGTGKGPTWIRVLTFSNQNQCKILNRTENQGIVSGVLKCEKSKLLRHVRARMQVLIRGSHLYWSVIVTGNVRWLYSYSKVRRLYVWDHYDSLIDLFRKE